MIKKILVSFAIAIVVTALIAGLVYGYIVYWPLESKGDKAAFKVKWGTSFQTATDSLYSQGFIRSKKEFKIAAELLKKTKKLKAGIFELTKGSSNSKILKDLIEGKQIFLSVTIPEGITSTKIASILQRKLELDSTRIISLVKDSTFISSMGVDAKSLEGYLYPETYNFTYGLTEKQIVGSFVRQFKSLYTDSLKLKSEKLGFTTNDVLALASIIEGEAMIDSEMVFISSVYHNRLKKGMRLQADPTIQYIIPDGPRRLLTRDLEIDSPYNTYKYTGLPPGPISNPGILAIKAAVNPADTDFIFFVADGKGGHIFAKTLKQHLRAKAKFDEIRREVAREKRKNSR